MSSNLLDVLRYEGDNSTIVHKHKIQDFNTKSQLIVGESQEALFYKDGQALDLFGPGRHSLNSDNLPILKKIFSKIFGGTNPFQCEVFFINKVSVLDLMWGTDSPIVMEDPKYNLIIGVKSFGQMGIKVLDSRKFVVKVVGCLDDFSIDSIKKATKGMVMLSIKDTIAKAICDKKWSILELPSKLSELSEEIKKQLNVHLESVGLVLENFFVNNVAADDKDLDKLRAAREKRVEALNDIDIEAIKTVRMGQAMAASREAQGYSYQDERKFDVMQAAAQNEGISGTMMGASMGIGMGFGMGNEINKVTNQTITQTNSTEKCADCGAILTQGAKFCSGCGKPIAPKKVFCISCGAELSAGSRFCSSCGAEQASANKVCPSCQTQVSSGNRFCHVCGHDFNK